MSHHVEPAAVVGMARLLYDTCPGAWLLTIPGSAFTVGDTLSPTGKRNNDLALDLVYRWLIESGG
jgi:hypothetical protein